MSCVSLTETNASRDAIIAEQSKHISLLEQQNELLKFKLEQMERALFGRKSEKQFPDTPEQAQLFESAKTEEPELEEEEVVEAYKRIRRSKKVIPDDLPIEEIVYEPEETECPECGGALEEFSRDVREELEFNPMSFFRRHHVTVHCSCPKCKQVVSGETPVENKPVIPGSQVGAGFLSHMVTSRICDHLPYYRQSQMYGRLEVYFPDKTLSRYGLIVGSLLEPVAKAIKQELLKKKYLQADETRLEVLDQEKSPNTHTGQLWVLNDPLSSLTYYEYHRGRNQEAADLLLKDFTGTLQTDGYVCYDKHEGEHAACLAHARRYFVKAKKLAPRECNQAMKLIGELYRVEREMKKARGKMKRKEWFEHRQIVRTERSLPILEKLQQYLVTIKDKWLLEEHPMYTAVNYMLNRFGAFRVYASDGSMEIDNNDIERMIRPVAIGRKNWLFAGSHHGAKMAAVMMTVVQTCKQKKIDPQKYLRDVLPRLAQKETTSLHGLSPFDWNNQ